jgi:Carbamoyltransferase C-terminus
MEWGPRALGNRSILCDPRRPDMKATLNAKIKRRESFRPFAPSVMEEAVAEWFEEDDSVPFMMQVFQVREEKRKLIPAAGSRIMPTSCSASSCSIGGGRPISREDRAKAGSVRSYGYATSPSAAIPD